MARAKSALRRHSSYDRVHRVRTGDGWPIALYEYAPRGSGPGGSKPPAPLLACHGAFSRYNIYDMDAGFGLAPYLARRGWHVFCLDLRGRGRSLPRRTDQRLSALLSRGWTFEDFLKHDLPGAIEAVLEKTGAKQTDYIGHSMGGMLGLHYLAETRDERVRRVITVGSAGVIPKDEQARMQESGEKRVDLFSLVKPAVDRLPVIPMRPLARGVALTSERFIRTYLKMGFNPNNMTSAMMRRYLWHGVASVSSKKFAFFQEYFVRADPAKAEERMRRYRHPTLLVAGTRDYLVPLSVVRYTYDLISEKDKKLAVFGKAQGHRDDYGHGDLLIGRRVEEEVFPEIESWLATA